VLCCGAQWNHVVGIFHKMFISRGTKNPQVSVTVPTCFLQEIEARMTDLKVNPLLITFLSKNTVLHDRLFSSFCILKKQNNCIKTKNQPDTVRISVMHLTDQYKHFYMF